MLANVSSAALILFVSTEPGSWSLVTLQPVVAFSIAPLPYSLKHLVLILIVPTLGTISVIIGILSHVEPSVLALCSPWCFLYSSTGFFLDFLYNF